jgi:hypothetical protein
MSALATIMAFIKALPQLIEFMDKALAFLAKEKDAQELANSLKQLSEAIAKVKATAVPDPANPTKPTGNTSAIEDIFKKGGKP